MPLAEAQIRCTVANPKVIVLTGNNQCNQRIFSLHSSWNTHNWYIDILEYGDSLTKHIQQ